MPNSVKSFLILSILITEVKSQPDSRFRPFDWVLYKGSGEINSITEGYTFAYIATNEGGIKRFNLYGNYFDEPLTTAQGLQENSKKKQEKSKKSLRLNEEWWISGYFLQKLTGLSKIKKPKKTQRNVKKQSRNL